MLEEKRLGGDSPGTGNYLRKILPSRLHATLTIDKAGSMDRGIYALTVALYSFQNPVGRTLQW